MQPEPESRGRRTPDGRHEPLRTGGGAREGKTDDQSLVTRRYDRMARWYDLYNAPMEWFGVRRRRRRVVEAARGRVLEVGVGTGKNLAFYPAGTEVIGIDTSGAMIDRARRRAERSGHQVFLEMADVQNLRYPDEIFDTSLATSVFCSVADPIAGLRELNRVTKRDGRILLLEHVRPRNPLLGRLADLATRVTRRAFGFEANRRTEDNIVAAGLEILEVRSNGIWREITARPTNARPKTTPADNAESSDQ